jgi:hypothetical protein
MLPVLEMAAERAVFIADPIYGYRINNPASDHNHDAETREPRERELAHVRALPRYERIEWPEPARCYPWEDPDPKTEAVVL